MDRLRLKKGPVICPWPFAMALRRQPKRTGPMPVGGNGGSGSAAAAAASTQRGNNANSGNQGTSMPPPSMAPVQPESLEIPIDPVGKEWTCCFGLHVHTATIMIGLWHLFLNVLALCLLAIIWRNPHMVDELDSTYDYGVDLSAPALPTPLSKVEAPIAFRDRSTNYRKQYQNFDMGGLVCTCMIAITLMLLYGTIKGKPSHLLPFFCLQIFDFAITTLTAAGYVCYLQAMHRLISESHRVPWREKLLELSPEELMVVVLVVFVCIVFLKAYAIGIVWRCYKYLHIRQQNMRTFLACVMPADIRTAHMIAEEQRAYTTLLPNYDEAISQYMKQPPPPSYQAAMSNFRVPVAVPMPNSVAEEDEQQGGELENNNDSSNNNNTVHFNANTPPMQHRNDAQPPPMMDDDLQMPTTSAAALRNSLAHDEEEEEDEEPPAYNFSVAMPPQESGNQTASPTRVTLNNSNDESHI